MELTQRTLFSILIIILSEHHILILGVHPSKRDACIAHIGNRYFRTNSTVAVITMPSQDSQQQPSISLQPVFVEDDIVQQVDLRWKFSFVILQLHLNGSNCTCSHTIEGFQALKYFVIIGNAGEVARCIQTFCFVGLTGYHTRFVVYLNNEPENADKHVESVLEKFWEHNHQNVIVLITNLQGDIDIYTWFPLEENSRAEIVDTCEEQLLRNATPLFPMKLPRNLNGKKLRVGLMRTPPYTCKRIGGGYAGVDVDIMEAMASDLNFTLDYVLVERLRRRNESESGYWKGQIGPWKTILLRAVAGEVDIALGGFTLEPEAIDVLGYTQSYYRDSTGIFATSDLVLAHDMGRWIARTLPLALFLSLCTGVVMHLLQWSANPKRSDFGGSVMMAWSLLTEASADLSRLSTRQAVLWAICAFYAININTAYRSLLTSVLARPLYAEKIQTIDDIVRFNTPFLVHGEPQQDPEDASGARESQLGLSASREVIDQLLERMVPCTDPLYRCLFKFLTVPHYSLYAYTLDMRFVQSSLPNRIYHTVSTDMFFSEISIYTRKNFFLTPKMTMMIHRSAQAGLINYWINKSLRNYKLCSLSGAHWSKLIKADANGSYPKPNPSHFHQPLSIKRMEIQFWLLGAGLFVAGVSFIVEVFVMTKNYKLARASVAKCYQTFTRRRIQL